jgi:hypothetical protein
MVGISYGRVEVADTILFWLHNGCTRKSVEGKRPIAFIESTLYGSLRCTSGKSRTTLRYWLELNLLSKRVEYGLFDRLARR